MEERGLHVEGNQDGGLPFLLKPLVCLAAVALCGSVAPLAPGPALCIAIFWGGIVLAKHSAFVGRRRRLLWCALGASAFLICGARSTDALDRFERDYFELRDEVPAPVRCAGRAVVERSPVLRTREEDDESVVLWTGSASHLDCEGTRISRTVPVRLYGGPHDLSRGDQVEFVAQLAVVRLFRNAGLPNPWPGAARRGQLLSGSALVVERLSSPRSLAQLIDRARYRVRARIVASYSETAAPLGRALVLGENDLHEEDAEAFRQSGLLHLLAVSGTHLVIAVLALVGAMGAVLVRIEPLARRWDVRRASSLVGAGLSLLYADFSGGSGSAWRAAFMLCVVCGGRALGLRIRGSDALGASLLVGLAVNPLLGSDYSFLLSALATSGLIGIGQPLSRWAQWGWLKRAPLRQLSVSFIATVSSTIPCAPILAMMDGDMTGAALFANVVAAPLGEVIALPACLLHAVVHWLPALEQGLALVGSGALQMVRHIALWSASVEQAQFPVPFPSSWNITLLTVGVLLFTLRPKGTFRSLLLYLAPALTLTGLHLIEPKHSPPGHLSVTALDVGQGDALLIDFPDGRVGLMDGGGFATGIPDTGERIILPVLRARGINHLDLVILSHAHPDHVLGLLSVARQVPIRELWLPRHPTRKQGWLAELVEGTQRSKGVVKSADELCGALTWGGVSIEVIAPCQLGETRLGENDSSLVLHFRHEERSALLTGDIEKQGEALILARAHAKLQADLLKVAHHGSDTSSTPAFVNAVRPKYAMISSGVRNRFNHPRPATLRTLSERSIAVLRTDRLGSLTWSTDGRRSWTRSFSAAPPHSHSKNFFAEVYLQPRKTLSRADTQTSLSHGEH